jgi:hypothetical protein
MCSWVSFFFGDYIGADVVVFEFSWDRFKFNIPQLKRLLEGEYFMVDVKCVCRLSGNNG